MRYNKAKNCKRSIIDFGAEEIEFYTLNYPKTIGEEWEIDETLQKELEQFRKCMPTRILFMDASNEVLLKHRENDNTRSRIVNLITAIITTEYFPAAPF